MEKLGFEIDVHRASEVGRRSLRVEGLKVSSILLTKNHAATQESTSIYQIFGRMRTEREKKKSLAWSVDSRKKIRIHPDVNHNVYVFGPIF
jgi:hypothetical protein